MIKLILWAVEGIFDILLRYVCNIAFYLSDIILNIINCRYFNVFFDISYEKCIPQQMKCEYSLFNRFIPFLGFLNSHLLIYNIDI